jgi:hypothetical protein
MLIGSILFLCSCRQQTQKLFTELSSSQTGIDFRNDIVENESRNILTYEYLYNGGGVAVGDLNNDGLADILFTGNMTPDRLYLNKGGLAFEDITDEAGIKGRNIWKTGVVMADVNGDGLLDIYICYSGEGTDDQRTNQLYINKGIKNGVPFFEECAKRYGLDAPGTFTTTVAFFDMDNDGDLDMFMVNHADMYFNPFFNTSKLRATRNQKFGNRLYRNDNGHFTDISVMANIDGSGLNFGLGVAISDLNNDGWSDIYVTNDYTERDFLYLNNRNGTFREVLTKAAGHISQSSMGNDIADYNNDRRPDIMVLDMKPEHNYRQKLLKGDDNYGKYMMEINAGFYKQEMRNTLQLNSGLDSAGIPIFSEVGQFAGVSKTDWSWDPLFADFNNDGWKDLFISNGILKDLTNLDFIKATSGYSEQYNNAARAQNNEQLWRFAQQMTSTELHNYIFENNHDLTFTDVTDKWGIAKKSVSNGSAYVDLDNDGDLDLVINNLDGVATIYRNNTAETTRQHYIRIKLKGSGGNTYGIGAKVYVESASTSQFQEQYPNRGYQSSVDPIMHIGLGEDSVIKTIKVEWPGGNTSLIKDVKADSLIVIRQSEGPINQGIIDNKGEKERQTLFQDVTASSGINFVHHPSRFIDFNAYPLLPYQISKIGPCLAKADVNGDGLEDLFIGSSAGQASVLYLQTHAGKFLLSKKQPWAADPQITVADAVFFDADRDGDMDLYLVSGGADYASDSKNYQDRFYENDGKGNFSQVNALPDETVSGSCARVADIDKDGLPDLFVGGKLIPGHYPLAAESFVLKNKSTKGNIRFERDNMQRDSTLKFPGMVTDAAWLDIDKDGWDDLVVVGEFMPITVFKNHNGQLVNETEAYGLSQTNGWWSRIFTGDFDNDGDSDLVVGNLGTNVPFSASVSEPLSIIYGDFFGNGRTNVVLCYYDNGLRYPYYSRDVMAAQMPSITKKFLRYADYAKATLNDIVSSKELVESHTIKINTLQSVYLRNDNKKLVAIPLPLRAQISPVNGIVAVDINRDGKKDMIISGNFYPFRVSIGPMDAGMGLVLEGNGKGQFIPLPYALTNLDTRGDVRDMLLVKTSQDSLLIAAKNNGALQVIRLPQEARELYDK